MNEEFRKEVFKRLEQMGLTEKRHYINFIRVDFITVV